MRSEEDIKERAGMAQRIKNKQYFFLVGRAQEKYSELEGGHGKVHRFQEGMVHGELGLNQRLWVQV